MISHIDLEQSVSGEQGERSRKALVRTRNALSELARDRGANLPGIVLSPLGSSTVEDFLHRVVVLPRDVGVAEVGVRFFDNREGRSTDAVSTSITARLYLPELAERREAGLDSAPSLLVDIGTYRPWPVRYGLTGVSAIDREIAHYDLELRARVLDRLDRISEPLEVEAFAESIRLVKLLEMVNMQIAHGQARVKNPAVLFK